ncbi:hypothetical protein [Thermoflavimicrobium daqui]|nr:hypothetical protein [Thermoflavimicrobium daqui]
MGKKVNGKCRHCGREGTLIRADGGKVICTACDNPQYGGKR